MINFSEVANAPIMSEKFQNTKYAILQNFMQKI